MPTFLYNAIASTGEKKEAELIAENRQGAIGKLQDEGYIVLSLEEKLTEKKDKRKKITLSRTEKLMFTKHLAAMIGAGLTIAESLEILKQQNPGKKMKQFLEILYRMIESGQSLANSLVFFEKAFSPIYTNMIRVGEEAGNLDEVFSYLEIQLQKDYELVKRVKSAMIYPIVILTVTMGLALFLIAFIIPKITKIFSTFKMTLPLATRMLIKTDQIMRQHWLMIIIITILTVLILRWIKNRPAVKPYTHGLVLKLPIIGKLSKLINSARFTRILSSLLKSGVPLVKSLDIVSKTVENIHYQKLLSLTKNKVENGASLGDSLAMNQKLISPIISRMIMVGEKTGTLEKTSENLANMFEKDVDNITKSLSTMMEPLLLLVMGAIVGGIALSIITPIYQIPQMIQR